MSRGHAYIGHMFSSGFPVVDVGDPRAPTAVNDVFVDADRTMYATGMNGGLHVMEMTGAV